MNFFFGPLEFTLTKVHCMSYWITRLFNIIELTTMSGSVYIAIVSKEYAYAAVYVHQKIMEEYNAHKMTIIAVAI